jgi:hypothetical protein
MKVMLAGGKLPPECGLNCFSIQHSEPEYQLPPVFSQGAKKGYLIFIRA